VCGAAVRSIVWTVGLLETRQFSRCHFLERGILKLEDCDCGMQPYLPAVYLRVYGDLKGEARLLTFMSVRSIGRPNCVCMGGPNVNTA
jgi:hypothetical protein